jgi:hypothetical protein
MPNVGNKNCRIVPAVRTADSVADVEWLTVWIIGYERLQGKSVRARFFYLSMPYALLQNGPHLFITSSSAVFSAIGGAGMDSSP